MVEVGITPIGCELVGLNHKVLFVIFLLELLCFWFHPSSNCEVNSPLSPAGGYGVDFSQKSDDVAARVSLVARKILEHGVTSFCPTLVTSPPAVYHKVLRRHGPVLSVLRDMWEKYYSSVTSHVKLPHLLPRGG